MRIALLASGSRGDVQFADRQELAYACPRGHVISFHLQKRRSLWLQRVGLVRQSYDLQLDVG